MKATLNQRSTFDLPPTARRQIAPESERKPARIHTSNLERPPISPGQATTAQNVYLEQGKVPVPEFSDAAVAVLPALATTTYLLKRSRR